MTEQILAVTRYLVEEVNPFTGIDLDLEKCSPLFDSRNYFHIPRDKAETQPLFKQLIPYVILVRENKESGEPEVLWYSRTKTGNEVRLRTKSSIGFGGHITDRVVPGMSLLPIENGTYHELYEELRFSDYDRPMNGRVRIKGVLNDDEQDPSNPEFQKTVGSVHTALVMTCWCKNTEEIESGEDKIELGGWMSIEALQRTLDLEHQSPYVGAPSWENWSKHCIQRLDHIVKGPGSNFWDMEEHIKTGLALQLKQGKRVKIGGRSRWCGQTGTIDCFGYMGEIKDWAAMVVIDGAGSCGPIRRHELFSI